jgi:hypothetical protein
MMVRHRNLLQFFQLVAVAVVAILETRMVNQVVLAVGVVMLHRDRVGLETHHLEVLHKETMAVMVIRVRPMGLVEVAAAQEPQERRLLQAQQQQVQEEMENKIQLRESALHLIMLAVAAVRQIQGTAGTGGLGGGGAGGRNSGPGTNGYQMVGVAVVAVREATRRSATAALA